MSIFRLNREHFENYELIANPPRTYTSSSAGITGSVPLFADSSDSLKELASTFGSRSGSHDDASLDEWRSSLAETVSNALTASTSVNVYDSALKYLDLVNSQSNSPFFEKEQHILRFTPGVDLGHNHFRKSTIKNILFPYYRNVYPTLEWSYTNYHCLNFVTGGILPTDSVLIYPAGTGSVEREDYNPLGPANKFTFDFWINPRYTTENPGDEYNAGTIMHMSSCYAISLVSGSEIGADGKSSAFRLMLQLSHSADTLPTTLNSTGVNNTRSFPNDLVFLSNDNSLKKNQWHHVAIRWDSAFNNGTGSFHIDGSDTGLFSIASSSVMQVTSANTNLLDPDALFVGNYYKGNNAGANAIAHFFNSGAHVQEGVMCFSKELKNDPLTFDFPCPLNAEIHDLKIFDRYRNNEQTATGSKSGVSLNEDGLLFYVPPFFTKDSRTRNVMQTPFFDARGSTEDPFNVALSFGVGAMMINLENFTKDLVTKQFPRLMNLTGAIINSEVQIPRTANYLLYESGSTIKRNLTAVPCDNGKFFPNFDLISSKPEMGIFDAASGSITTSSFGGTYDDRFTDDLGNKNYSFISLRSMVDTGSLLPGLPPSRDVSGSLLASTEGATPEDPGVSPGNILSVLQRTHDPSSNEVVFFDISNMFYGDQIKPGSFVIEDLAVSGSGERVKFKVRDNEKGNLYRANSDSEHAKWASVGNILYEEGIVVIKTPSMPHFGKDSFKVTFEGDRKVYVLEILIPALNSQHNSSNNPTYKALAPSNYPSELSDKFSYITGITLHDNNLNVVGRAHLAQPVVKRDEDRLVFRLRMDF